MSQATLDDDELFDEAAREMRADVEAGLSNARAALPEPADVWNVEADNTLGVLNGLKGALDTGDAEDHLRDAKKWFAMGRKADAFDDADALADDIESVETLLEQVVAAHDRVGELSATIPQLRGALEEAHADAADESDAADEDDAEDEEDAA